MQIEVLMRRLAEAGVTVILKADHERFAEGGEYWTLVISGPNFEPQILVRAEATSLAECLGTGLSRLRALDDRWGWVSEYLDQPEV